MNDPTIKIPCTGERGETARGQRPVRCACARKFWRQGGTARLKTIPVEVSITMYHGRKPEPKTERTVTYKAINSSDALYQSKTDLYDEFIHHVEGCGAAEECYMSVSHHTRGTSTGFAIGRDDLKAA